MQTCMTSQTLQSFAPTRTAPRSARQSRCVVQANANMSTRRSAGLALATLPALLAVPAFARDAEKARATAEQRKEQLQKAAQEMRETGKTASAFDESKYAVSEDKSPNVHTRQEEGVRESAN